MDARERCKHRRRRVLFYKILSPLLIGLLILGVASWVDIHKSLWEEPELMPLPPVIELESLEPTGSPFVIEETSTTQSSVETTTVAEVPKLQKKKAVPKKIVRKEVKKKTVSSGTKLTKRGGVNYFNGNKETWYSQRVLPGGGLKIPGRYVCKQGLVRDKDNYIVVASSDLKKGSIISTSLGKGKVYDTGCPSGVVDIYTDW